MGMATFTRDSTYSGTMIIHPFNHTLIHRVVEPEYEFKAEDKHPSELNLRVLKNNKIKGGHCNPFYQSKRW